MFIEAGINFFILVTCLIYHICSLYQKIDTENLECLNESVDGSGKTVFKSWEDRLDKTKASIVSIY